LADRAAVADDRLVVDPLEHGLLVPEVLATRGNELAPVDGTARRGA
jgi:hypothetical protein